MELQTYQAKLEAAYQGEFYGIAMYRRIAEARTSPDEARKWQLLTQLEEETRAVLEPLLHRHGMMTEPLAESLNAGEADAENYKHLSWAGLMRRFSDELDEDIAEYTALLDLAPAEDRAAIRFLVHHEIVAKAFCESELNGNAAHSTEPVEALIASAPGLLAAS